MANIDKWKYFSEIELMTGLWYGEARIVEDNLMEEIREYLAIGGVVMNRARMRMKPVRSIILAPKQFSCFNEGDPNEPKIENFLKNRVPSDLYNRCKIYADKVIRGKVLDFSNGSTHYVARWLYERPDIQQSHPWIPKCEIRAVWGGHIFLLERI